MLETCTMKDIIFKKAKSSGQIIGEVLNAVKEWRTLATKLGIAKSEQERFAAVFEKQILSYDRNKEK